MPLIGSHFDIVRDNLQYQKDVKGYLEYAERSAFQKLATHLQTEFKFEEQEVDNPVILRKRIDLMVMEREDWDRLKYCINLLMNGGATPEFYMEGSSFRELVKKIETVKSNDNGKAIQQG